MGFKSKGIFNSFKHIIVSLVFIIIVIIIVSYLQIEERIVDAFLKGIIGAGGFYIVISIIKILKLLFTSERRLIEEDKDKKEQEIINEKARLYDERQKSKDS